MKVFTVRELHLIKGIENILPVSQRGSLASH